MNGKYKPLSNDLSNSVCFVPLLLLLLLSDPKFVKGQYQQQSNPSIIKRVIKPQPAMSEAEIQEARELLGSLGYWVTHDLKGVDTSLRHALIAFQKIEGRNRTRILTPDELEALRKAQRPQALEWGYPHIEVDLKRQVLFVVDCCGAILRILPVSSGTGKWFTEGGRRRRAITPTGRFKIQWKIKGYRKSPLGLLYYPNYIFGGIAIHGNPSVPPYPASHGCIRIPMFAAKEFSKMATVGMDVIIHDGNPINEVTDEGRAQQNTLRIRSMFLSSNNQIQGLQRAVLF